MAVLIHSFMLLTLYSPAWEESLEGGGLHQRDCCAQVSRVAGRMPTGIPGVLVTAACVLGAGLGCESSTAHLKRQLKLACTGKN